MTVTTSEPPTPIVALGTSTVPLGTGPPTREELLAHYPAKFTWQQLKTFVNSGDLGLLKRDRKLQARYDTWAEGIREEYGSIVNYLSNYRLRWGEPDRLSKLHSILDDPADRGAAEKNPRPALSAKEKKTQPQLPPIPDSAPPYFIANTPPEFISICMNDWPYSVPPEIEHALIWTCLPIMPTGFPPNIAARLHQDGLWGFTGNTSPPPSPSLVPEALPALAEWGVTLDKLVRSQRGTPEEEQTVRRAGGEINEFVKRRWKEREWETAWFVNPPRLQSVPGLAHIHVFARRKTPAEQMQWDAEHSGSSYS
ncbi:hypothetical protein CERSUDRAFT_133109 [Gelatoporia subvermispora B]|uniref:Uncharacterized protein n=1 Tax=Ceriporiopsis subvermispora (strain B) TaxID=914234 RepID=M2RMV9_CERS8|nr:hypothetical protein CERSUDRAFT_133109 [Gelatoporia subvermispora B]